MGALFLAGLVGGGSHCAAMCGPFVLAQVSQGAGLEGGRLARLSGALLLPYHLGRMLGYAGLGALAGGFAAGAGLLPGLGWLPPALLLLAAAVMLSQALPARWRPAIGLHRMPRALAARVAPLLDRPGARRSFVLGVLLSALPCGLLYAALAGAAASGSALAGALAMAAFVAGTVPALVGVAVLGGFFRKRAAPAWQRLAPAIYGFNSLVLAGLAFSVMP